MGAFYGGKICVLKQLGWPDANSAIGASVSHAFSYVMLMTLFSVK